MRPGTDSLDLEKLDSNGRRPDQAPSSEPRGEPAADDPSDFASRFTREIRAKSALNPRSLRVFDVVDVFADSGEFLFRGIVEARDEQNRVQIRYAKDGEKRKTALQIVRIENCRYADALSPPTTLSQWEADRGVDSSMPPY